MTEKISLAKENAKHIANLNDEMGEVRNHMVAIKREVSTVRNDVDWLKKFFFIIATSSIGSLILQLIK